MAQNPSQAQAGSSTYARETESRGAKRPLRGRGDPTFAPAPGVRDAGRILEEKGVLELLCQALETEISGIRVYETAIRCAVNEELRDEWQKYLNETRNHERTLREVFQTLQLDPETHTPGREVVRGNSQALVAGMEKALAEGESSVAQIVAAECVVLAETKDHLNWELIGEIAKKFVGEGKTALQDAYDEIEDQEDEHLYHTRGWARELWLESLGLPAVLPPPEETQNVRTAIDAARVKDKRSRSPRGRKNKTTRSKKASGIRARARPQAKRGR